MPFNSKSYYRNKARRQAMNYLAAARTHPDKRELYVKLCRNTWSIYLGALRMERCDRDLARFKRGEITYQQFMDKWDPRKGQANGN